MPAPLPPTALGISVGPAAAPVTIDIHIDMTCPFSKKIYDTMAKEVIPWVRATSPEKVKFTFYLTPQPWHPQSSMLAEAICAVGILDASKCFAFTGKVFDNQEQFYDCNTYSKSRQDIYAELSVLAAEFVDTAKFMDCLAFKSVDGQRNSGNETTQMIKWLAKYHRANGVHVTPTCFVNRIEAGHVSSGWSLEEWQGLLGPFL